MARPLRIEFAGALYHVSSRGDGEDDIYLDDGDRERWLAVVAQVCDRFNWRVHAYCQMTNHYHLLIETPDANLARGMRQFNGVYTQWFNQTHGRAGHVFQGRYKAILVERDAYFLELSRYIVLSPGRARMVRTVRDWRWSNYRDTVGMRMAPEWLETGWTLAAFGKRKRAALEGYRKFVAEGKNQPSPLEAVRGQIYLGSEKFVKRMERKIGADKRLSEVPKSQRRPLEWYFKKHKDRDTAVFAANRTGRYSRAAIAAYVGLHYSTVSRIIALVEEGRRKA